MEESTQDITQLLADWTDKKDAAALERLTPLVYGELRKLAHSYLRRERQDHTLEPTALIHEAYLRLVDQRLPQWKNRTHFYGIAAQLMRQILVDHARVRAAAKRGGGEQKLSLDAGLQYSDERSADLVALDDALKELAKLDERKAKIVELRYFGGLSIDEIVQAMELSSATVGRELRFAEAWLHKLLTGEERSA
jgi:RNA polymerase sigma factor (TIGR02999 family)